MDKYNFVVSDETINSYGFIVKTSGINYERFLKNPIMLFMHDRSKGVIGKWENLRVENSKLIATAVFDDTTELSQQVKNQVDKGFLRATSIGIKVLQDETNADGIITITSCMLEEISIVDIPSNENAVKLYKKNGKFAISLTDALEDKNESDLKTALISLLGLDENASNDDIITFIKNALQVQKDSINEQINNALKCGYITENQKDIFITLAKSNYKEFDAYLEKQKKIEKANIFQVISTALNKGIFWKEQVSIYQTIGEKIGLKFLENLIATLPKPMRPSDILDSAKKDSANKNLHWYRKNAPEELKNNPELYKQLVNDNKQI